MTLSMAQCGFYPRLTVAFFSSIPARARGHPPLNHQQCNGLNDCPLHLAFLSARDGSRK
jgi:hypothetical protein